MSVVSVLGLFHWYAKNNPNKLSKKSPFTKRLVDDYLNKLDQVVWYSNEDDVTVFENLIKLIRDGTVNHNNIDWSILYPQNNNFGFTGPHLSEREQRHFSAIEAIFKSELNDVPQGWKIFDQRKVIGQVSVYGTILEVGPSKNPDMFVIKSPQIDSKELLHEFLVGQMVSNPLRRLKIPNFPYYFGIIKCSKVHIDNKRNIKEWCKPTEQVPQIIMENIKSIDDKGNQIPAITLKEFILNSNETTIDLVIIYFLGVVNSIFTAFVDIGFSHNDLHTNNILLRTIALSKNKWMIPMVFNSGYLIAKAGDMIPTLIDFGKSSFENEKIFITFPQNMVDNEPNSFGKSRPMNDILHLMAFIDKDLSEKRTKTTLDFGKRVSLVLEQIYDVFYSLISDTPQGSGILFEKVAVIPTLEDFKSQTGNKSLFFNLPPTMMFIENENFLKKFIDGVLKIKMIQPHLENNFVLLQHATMVQPIDPTSISNLIEGSTRQSGIKRVMVA